MVNSTNTVQDVKGLLSNSSLLTEVKQAPTTITKNQSNQENATQGNDLSSGQQIKQSDNTTNQKVNFTVIK